MRKKRARFFALILAAGMTFSACAAKEKDKTEKNGIRIGVTVYDSHDTFISQLMNKFNSYGGSSVSIVTDNAAQNQKTQNEQVEEMIYSGCDVICVNLVDRTDPTKIIEMAEKNNVPVIFFNRELVEGDLQRWNKLYYVGADASQSGTMQGEMVLEDINSGRINPDKNGDGVIQYIVLEGEAGHQDAIVRTEASVATIIDGGIMLDDVGSAIANWNREQAQTKVNQLLNQKTDIELILANNDDMALGALDAFREAGFEEGDIPPVYGIDGTDEGLTAVKEGQIPGTVYNDKEGQAKAMYDLALKLAQGKSLSGLNLSGKKYIWLPYNKVTAENVDDYMGK